MSKDPTSKSLGDTLARLQGALDAAPCEPGASEVDWVTERPPPPLHLWQPEHCGDIGMEIRSDGSWWHAGSRFKRQELVNLFASILRRESDGEYYLVTPVEKVRVSVELHPLRVVDADYDRAAATPTLMLSLNTGGIIPLDARHPLKTEPKANDAAYVELSHGLSALFSRSAWYRLAEWVDDSGAIESGGCRFQL